MNGDGFSRGEGARHSSSRDHQSSRGDRSDRGDRGDRGDRSDRGERLERSDRDERRDRGDRGDRNRRRSRSPDIRGGRGSRRDGVAGGGSAADADSYSMSRSHRDREREDRYSSGRDRRDWDRDRERDRDRDRDRDRNRDRGDRDRDRRRGRDDDDRHDHHHRGGRRGDRDRDRDGARDRRRSGSPSHRKREPTPDLTGVVSVLERKRRLTQWDIKPPNYENVTAEQAKMSGMFPLPGQPRQQPMDINMLQAFIAAQPPPLQPSTASVLKPTNSREAKRLLVSNLPASVTSEEDLLAFFNLQLNGLNVIEGTDPCVHAQLSADKKSAALEFRESSDATVALALDGISMEADEATNGAANGAGSSHGLSIHRPKDYIVPAIVDYSGYQPGVVSQVVVDTPNKIAITNIPPYLTDDQVTELLVAFGELRAFVLVKDRTTEESRGIAFCEYAEAASTEIAIQGLNGMDLGDRKLKVTKASVGVTQVSGMEMGVRTVALLAGTVAEDASDASQVIQLLNMVTADDLIDNDDYEDICEDVRDECAKFGKVEGLKVPRPSVGSRQSPGVGKIYVKFDSTDAATKALKALTGRRFADKTVVATYFPEENYEVEAW